MALGEPPGVCVSRSLPPAPAPARASWSLGSQMSLPGGSLGSPSPGVAQAGKGPCVCMVHVSPGFGSLCLL